MLSDKILIMGFPLAEQVISVNVNMPSTPVEIFPA